MVRKQARETWVGEDEGFVGYLKRPDKPMGSVLPRASDNSMKCKIF